MLHGGGGQQRVVLDALLGVVAAQLGTEGLQRTEVQRQRSQETQTGTGKVAIAYGGGGGGGANGMEFPPCRDGPIRTSCLVLT